MTCSCVITDKSNPIYPTLTTVRSECRPLCRVPMSVRLVMVFENVLKMVLEWKWHNDESTHVKCTVVSSNCVRIQIHSREIRAIPLDNPVKRIESEAKGRRAGRLFEKGRQGSVEVTVMAKLRLLCPSNLCPSSVD
jgi:hypothetical protein